MKWTKPDFLLYRLSMLATGSLQPLIAVGLRLPDEAVRLAVAKPANHTHGLCEKAVNARGFTDYPAAKVHPDNNLTASS